MKLQIGQKVVIETGRFRGETGYISQVYETYYEVVFVTVLRTTDFGTITGMIGYEDADLRQTKTEENCVYPVYFN